MCTLLALSVGTGSSGWKLEKVLGAISRVPVQDRLGHILRYLKENKEDAEKDTVCETAGLMARGTRQEEVPLRELV